jgi:hypothetical protein
LLGGEKPRLIRGHRGYWGAIFAFQASPGDAAWPGTDRRFVRLDEGCRYDAAMAEATSKPFKPRRWLKRLTLAGLALLALLLGLRVVWGHVLASRIDDRVAAIQAKGEPTSLDDLDYPSLPTDQNGAVYLKQALALWPTIPGSATMRVTDSNWYLEGPDAGYADPITDDRAYLAACGPAIEAMRQAAACEDADWLGQPITASLLLNYGNHFGPMRRLARLLRDASYRATESGEIALALEIARLIDYQGKLIAARPVSADLLIMYGMQASAIAILTDLLPAITNEQLHDPDVRLALKTTSDQLLQSAWMKQAMQQSMIVDRCTVLNFVDRRADGTLRPANAFWSTDPIGDMITQTPGLDWLLRPLLDHTRLFLISNETNNAELFGRFEDAQSMTHANRMRDAEETFEQSPWLYPFASEFLWMDWPSPFYFNALARRRMAVTAIAIKLYEADHGERPAALDALVPDYLPAVPRDPYIRGRPIGYKPDGVVPVSETHYFDQYDGGWEAEERGPLGWTDKEREHLPVRPYPLLYCVGMDFTDHDGRLVMEPNGELEESLFQDQLTDIWFLLVPKPEPVEIVWDDPGLERRDDEVDEYPHYGQDAED